MELVFKKSGKEIKTALSRRREQLLQRLEKRNQTLDQFLAQTKKVRSYLVRNSQPTYGHGSRAATLYSQDDISSEEKEEISQLCQRIFELEQELYRLAAIASHLPDDQIVELTLNDLLGYGFEVNLEID
ncbi:hypothetical protein F8S13_24085 [Chloroflexia bacterium SDU3-3]|nr:hypothetical protein F8S13_24085 [Chloroflexia bacterium SDU3-3]